MNELLLTREASAASGIPTATLYHLIRFRKLDPLPARRGRLWLWSERDLENAAKAASLLRTRRRKNAAI